MDVVILPLYLICFFVLSLSPEHDYSLHIWPPHETQLNRMSIFLNIVNISSHISSEKLQSKKHSEGQTEGGALADGGPRFAYTWSLAVTYASYAHTQKSVCMG